MIITHPPSGTSVKRMASPRTSTFSSLIESLRGVHQRYPLGPGLFALIAQAIIEALNFELNVCYLDDGTLGDMPEKALDVLCLVMEKAADVVCRHIMLKLN